MLWKLNEKKGEGQTFSDEDLKGQVKHKVQERKDLREVLAVLLAAALNIFFREKAQGGVEGSTWMKSKAARRTCREKRTDIPVPLGMEEIAAVVHQFHEETVDVMKLVPQK